MNRRIDCAVLMLPAFRAWLAAPWTEPQLGPIHVQRLDLREPDDAWDGEALPRASYPPQAVAALARLAPALRRFDLCVLPVSPATLGWSRAALAQVRGELPVPLLILTRQVTASAVGDLLGLGAADFVPHSARPEEAKARLLRWALQPPAAAAHPRAQRHDPPRDAWLVAARAEGFRATRTQLLERFEREYVTGMLERFRGNVTHAARAGQQDRRAFWELMRKHSILSADFRRAQAASGPNR